MIDNPEQVDRLMSNLEDALPLPARATPQLLATLRQRDAAVGHSSACTVNRLHYLGDDGGIVCDVAFEESDGKEVVIASITHLSFDPRLRIAREIAAYQKHRTKRLQRQHALTAALYRY